MTRFPSLFAVAAMLLVGCSPGVNNEVRVTSQKPAAPVAAPVKPRREPIFYNGKTYQLDFAPVTGGNFAMAVSGMSAGQQKDAVAVATSSLRYFKCPDGQNGLLLDKPAFHDGQWRMTARCG